MAGALAAVDVEDFAGHEARPSEVEDRIDDVGNLAQPADWVRWRAAHIPTECIGVSMVCFGVQI